MEDKAIPVRGTQRLKDEEENKKERHTGFVFFLRGLSEQRKKNNKDTLESAMWQTAITTRDEDWDACQGISSPADVAASLSAKT